MSTFALIGGKTNNTCSNKIERHLISLSCKNKPNILFCPYASIKDISKSIDKFHKQMNGLCCNIVDMTLENISNFENNLIECDIFYIAGGHCDDLIQFFKEKGLDKILTKHIRDNIIFAGSSAGAMLYTMASMGDKYVYLDNFHYHNFKMVNCLGYLDITICPHYQNEDLTIYNSELKKYPYDGFGIEEDTMLVIKENTYYVVKEYKNKSVYYFNKNKGYIMIPLYEGVVYEKDCSFRSRRDI